MRHKHAGCLISPLFLVLAVAANAGEPAKVVRYMDYYSSSGDDKRLDELTSCIHEKFAPLKDVVSTNVVGETSAPDFYIRIEYVNLGAQYLVLWSATDAFKADKWAKLLPESVRPQFLREADKLAPTWSRLSNAITVQPGAKEWCAPVVLQIYSEVFRPYLSARDGQ